MSFYVDPATWLPVKCVRSGEDTEITSTYEDWRQTGGILTPNRVKVTETDKPEYEWKQISLRFEKRIARRAFDAPRAGPPDAFLQPGDMPRRIAEWCRAHSVAEPKSKGETCRLILQSLAARYCEVLNGLEELTGRKIRTIHIVGGGSRNSLLNRLVAKASSTCMALKGERAQGR